MKKNQPKIEPYQVRPFYTTVERECTSSMLVGMIVGAVLMLGILWLVSTARPHLNPCDVNRDGKVTATDLLIVKRAILEGGDR